MKAAYEAYFGRKITNIGKPWAPNNFCGNCSSRLTRWYKYGTGQLEIAVPAIWRQPVVHETDCFFCLMPYMGVGFNALKFDSYPWHAPSVDRPVPHDERHPVRPSPMVSSQRQLITPDNAEEPAEDDEKTPSAKNDDESFINMEPVVFNAEKFSALLDKMEPPLTKSQEKTLSSTLLEMNLLHLSRRSGRQRGLKRKNYAAIETPVYSEDIDLQVFEPDEHGEKGYQKNGKGEESDDDNLDPEYVPSKEEERLGDGKDGLCVIMDLICPVDNCSIRVHSRSALDEHLEKVHNALRYRCLAISCTASYVQR